MSNLTKHVGTTISGELYDQFDRLCRNSRKSNSQAITELIAMWTGRLDLMGTYRSVNPVVEKHITKSDIAIEQIQAGQTVGWRRLVEAINDLLFLNQLATTKRLIDQALVVARGQYGEQHHIVQDILQMKELWDVRSVTLEWDFASTWQYGSPASAGYFLIVPVSGKMRLSRIQDKSHPDFQHEDIKAHLRISPPPVAALVKHDRTVLSQEDVASDSE